MDQLERGTQEALKLLSDAYPQEIRIPSVVGREVWLGIGYLVGAGFAQYRGDVSYQLTQAGCCLMGDMINHGNIAADLFAEGAH